MGSGLCVGRLRRAEPRFVQCSDREVGSGVFAAALLKGRNNRSSVQGPRCWLRLLIRVLNKDRTEASSVQRPRCRLRSVCWGFEKGGPSLI